MTEGEPFKGTPTQMKAMIANQREIIAQHENHIKTLKKENVDQLILIQTLRDKVQRKNETIQCFKAQLRALQNAVNYIARKV